MSEFVEIDVETMRETDKAFLVKDAKDKEIWLPKSQCEADDKGRVTACKSWLAEREGLV